MERIYFATIILKGKYTTKVLRNSKIPEHQPVDCDDILTMQSKHELIHGNEFRNINIKLILMPSSWVDHFSREES